jgi:hypothetical protein
MELPPETCRARSLQKCNKLYIVASCWTITDIKFVRAHQIPSVLVSYVVVQWVKHRYVILQQERQCNLEASSSNHCCRGKAVSMKYCECVSVYLPSSPSMQCTCSVLYCRQRPVRFYHNFSHYLINMTIFGKKKLQDIKYVFWFSLQL